MPGPLGLYLGVLGFMFVGGGEQIVKAAEWLWRRRRVRVAGTRSPEPAGSDVGSPARPHPHRNGRPRRQREAVAQQVRDTLSKSDIPDWL